MNSRANLFRLGPLVRARDRAWVAAPSHQRDTFAIISGSITDSTAVERMATAAHVGFHTTIYPDYVAEHFFRDSVIERFGLAKHGRVAILRETGRHMVARSRMPRRYHRTDRRTLPAEHRELARGIREASRAAA